MRKQICFILDWYPTQTNNGCVFAKHLICAVADMGFDCVVIAPRVITKTTFRKTNQVPYLREEYTENGSKVHIFMPYYLHLTSRKQTMRLSMDNHYRSVMATIRREKLKPDLVYGHFLYQCGLTAARVGEKLGIPSYCACGENSLRLEKGRKPYDTGLECCGWKEIIRKLSGIISVSTNNKELLIQRGFVDESMPMVVLPNSVDAGLFHPMDKAVCREALGFPQDAFIVAYTGAFTVNKGIDVLNEALKDCENVHSVFLGQGAIQPDCGNVLFAGRVHNSQVATYLNAADVFVLPTKGEGCSNAIVEALACGLPVISSDLPFNDDILDETNSVRVDVEDAGQIAGAILALKEDSVLRARLTDGALKRGSSLEIKERACKILEFMNCTEMENGK